MKKTDQVNEAEAAWAVTFEQVEDAQLLDMLKATPELLEFSIKAQGRNSQSKV